MVFSNPFHRDGTWNFLHVNLLYYLIRARAGSYMRPIEVATIDRSWAGGAYLSMPSHIRVDQKRSSHLWRREEQWARVSQLL